MPRPAVGWPVADRSKPRPSWVGILGLLALGTLWGLSFPLAKIATSSGVSPVAYMFWQTAGAGTVLLSIGVVRRRLPKFTASHVVFYFLTGVVGVVLAGANMVWATRFVPTGLIAIVVNTVPLVTYALALALGVEGLHWRRALGIALGFAGVALILGPKASLPEPELLPRVALVFLTPLGYALANTLASIRRPADGDAPTLAIGMLAFAVACTTPITAATGSFYPIWPPFGPGEWALLTQIVVSSLAYILYFNILALAGPVFFSQVAYVVALTGLGWGIVLFDERFSPWIWAAVALIFAGIALVNWRGRANSVDR
jgi:drug/metabolite transporter (DMT)-like permease